MDEFSQWTYASAAIAIAAYVMKWRLDPVRLLSCTTTFGPHSCSPSLVSFALSLRLEAPLGPSSLILLLSTSYSMARQS